MNKCESCDRKDHCKMYADARAFYADVAEFGCKHFKPKQTKTNADRIRAMTDEELAEYLFDRGNCQEYCYGICDVQDECNGSPSDAYCISHIVKWLNKEVNDG